MTSQEYRDASHHLPAQARSELDARDVRQASEKGWGASALHIDFYEDWYGAGRHAN